ncbi:MAG: ATP-sensitive inward rectifier potassium channel 10 [Verrucomicrobia bacterium]|nr:ATP-sensitive inward rectifier potassium channel 10 [Verrucomicrobiota bacterium]
MSKSGRSISVRTGRLEFVKINITKFDFRDTYHLILTLTWPRFAALVLVTYIMINLLFAGLYLLGGKCIAELPPGSYSEAFFFSVETLATVGYGHMYPDTFYGHCVTTIEIVVGMFGMAVITGLIFVRFSRPTARILFSKCAVISPFDGVPTLMLRVANQRHIAMAEAEFRVMLFRNERIQEEESTRRFYALKLQFDRMIAFPVALTLRHMIDESSPLYGLTAEDLKRSDTRLMASIVCIDTVIPAPVQSAIDYSYDDILWNRRFVEIYAETPEGRLTVDYGRIHDTEEV